MWPREGNRPAATRPTLWLLSIGVSRYREASIGLQFADADAQAMAAALEGQKQGPIYSETKSMTLINEQVTRQSILGGIERFLGQAGPDDVAAIFMAGHGVQDRATGSYYFLPYPANAENLLTEGLRMSDFDEMIRVLQRNVPRVVVMLDTCHAGALRLTSRAVISADDLATQISAAEGLFLLAAAKPGEESKEATQLGHGVFTYSMIEGLRGAADVDGDSMVSVSEIFTYVARQVPRLTEGRQHPYHKIEGTDLTLAAIQRVLKEPTPTRPEAGSEQPVLELAVASVPNTIGVMEFNDLRKDPQHDWMGKALRAALDTELSKVRALRVVSPIMIDRRMTQGADELNTARQLGISKLLRGSFVVMGNTLRVDAEVVDVSSGMQGPSEMVEGQEAEFFELEKKLVFNVLQQLPVVVSTDEGKSIGEETNTNLNAYRLLLEARGSAVEPAPPNKKSPPKASGSAPKPQSFLDGWRRTAFAAELEDHKAEVGQLLQEYRRAHEQKDVDGLAALYTSLTNRQRNALHAYLDNAIDLRVELDDVRIETSDQDIVVSCTRRDHFKDRESGKTARLEIRVTQLWVHEGGTWKIADER
jgi:TolB-like protein/ketosteroid isomerase-like protein